MPEGYPAERFSIAAAAPKQTAALIRFGQTPALAPCEAVTQIDRAGVPDDVWAAARERFEEPELAQLLCAIAATNTWNRLQVATRALPGNYAPADREAVGGAAAGTTDDGAAAAGAAADAAAAGAGR